MLGFAIQVGVLHPIETGPRFGSTYSQILFTPNSNEPPNDHVRLFGTTGTSFLAYSIASRESIWNGGIRRSVQVPPDLSGYQWHRSPTERWPIWCQLVLYDSVDWQEHHWFRSMQLVAVWFKGSSDGYSSILVKVLKFHHILKHF